MVTTLKICRECGAEFCLPEVVSEAVGRFVSVCPTCSDKHALEEQREALRKSKTLRHQRWKAICPVTFQNTTRAKLPYPDRLDVALQWQYGPKGILLHGPTGSGKSRVGWEVLRREFYSARDVGHLDSFAGVKFASKFSRGALEVEHWLDRLTTVHVLLLDDAFKAKLTDAWEAALFGIVNQRTERGLPLIITANDTGATLLERLSPDRSEPFVRRLREFCQAIAFPAA